MDGANLGVWSLMQAKYHALEMEINERGPKLMYRMEDDTMKRKKKHLGIPIHDDLSH